jgi:uncharacterized protein with HEPN domain
MKNDLTYIEHIQDCLKTILEYIDEITHEDFMKSRMVQDACIRQFEVMGEATKRVSMDVSSTLAGA